jgi:uncharacterized membrane protein
MRRYWTRLRSANEPGSDSPTSSVSSHTHHLVDDVRHHSDVLAERVHHSVTHHLIPAWRRHTQGEHRAAVTVATLVAIGLVFALPSRVANRPHLLLPLAALTLLLALTIASPTRMEKDSTLVRVLSIGLLGVMGVANAASGIRLVIDLSRAQGIRTPSTLLLTGAEVWLTNIVVFALLYWECDRGGPTERAKGTRHLPDFLFPQMQVPEFCAEHWEPRFMDYLYLSFTNATAFSPTDVLPLARWAKFVMMIQSITSIVTVGLVIARAVNVLK